MRSRKVRLNVMNVKTRFASGGVKARIAAMFLASVFAGALKTCEGPTEETARLLAIVEILIWEEENNG